MTTKATHLHRPSDKSAAIAAAKASEGAELSPAAQALYEAEGADRFAKTHPKAAALTNAQVVQQMPATVRQAMAPKPSTPPSLRIGEIANRLGFGITESFLRHMDFVPAGNQGVSVLYHETDFPLICQALITHISEVQDQFEPVAD